MRLNGSSGRILRFGAACKSPDVSVTRRARLDLAYPLLSGCRTNLYVDDCTMTARKWDNRIHAHLLSTMG